MITQIAPTTKTVTRPDYEKCWRYYKNDASLYAGRSDLFAKVSNIYGYVTKVVDTDAALIPKGIRVVCDDEQLAEIINAIYRPVPWRKMCRTLAALGDAYLKLEVNEKSKQCTIKVLQTEQVQCEYDADGNVAAAEYSYIAPYNGTTSTYRESYSSDVLRMYRDGQLIEEKDNKYGFVPVYNIKFKDVGEAFGLNSYDHVLTKQDVLNVLGSFLYEISKKMADPIYTLNGDPKKTTDMLKAMNKNIAEGVNVMQLAEGMDFKIVEGGTDNYPNLLEFMNGVEKNIKENLPELSLADVKATNTSGYALSLMLYDLIAKIEEVRENLAGELQRMNGHIYQVLVSWGTIPNSTENYTEIAFDEVFDFSRADRLAEVKSELDMGLITVEVARQRAGIEYSGFEDVTAAPQTANDAAKSDENAASGSVNGKDGVSQSGDDEQSFIARIVAKVKSFFTVA